jgi:vesicle coat complex subunit
MGDQVKTAYRTKPSHEELLSAIGDDDPETVAHAATILGLRGEARASDALIQLLYHRDAAARGAAATALGLIGLESAIPFLRQATSDCDPEVAAAACVALQRIGDPDSADGACDSLIAELSAPDAERRALAARALGGLMRQNAVDPLLEALQDPSAQVRADAAGSLGWLGDPRATITLASVGFNDPDPYVREVAMYAVAHLVAPSTPV